MINKSLQKIFICVATFIAAFSIVSCTDIDELSNANQIESFTLVSHAPKTIELASTVIMHDTIYIPVKFGKYEFPLRFFAQMHISDDIDKVVGIDLSKEQCLQSIDDQIKFYVMAKSGMTRTYVIMAREIPLDENNYISTAIEMTGISPKLRYSSRALASATGDTLTMFTVGGTYPVEATPRFLIPDEASFEDFENGATPMSFTSDNNPHVIKVISKSGAKRYWKVKLKCAPIVSEIGAGITASQLATTNIDPRKLKITPGENSGCITYVDNSKSTIVIEVQAMAKSRSIEDGIIEFPYSVGFNFETMNGVELFDVKNDTTFVFNALDETKEFYLLDPLKGVARKWTVSLDQILVSNADVLGVTYDYTAATIPTDYVWESYKDGWVTKWRYKITKNEPCIKIADTKVEIYPELGEIIIPTSDLRIECVVPNKNLIYSGHNYKADRLWNLKMNNIVIKLPKGATADAPKNIEWASNYEPDFMGGDGDGILGAGGAVQNSCWTQISEFTVTAQDGTTKKWTIKLRDPKTTFVPSTECTLNSFKVAQVLPTYTKLDEQTPVIVDNSSKMVSIKLIDDEDCYPMSIYPEYATSTYSKVVSQNGGTDPLVFESPESIQKFMIRAQDGTTTSEWSVRLLPPAKAEGADIESFDILGFTAGFGVLTPIIDKDAGRIKLPLNATGKLPLEIEYNMSITDKATSTTPNRGSIRFAALRDKVSIEVVAQNGAMKLWTVELYYCPQIPNSGFNTWSTVNNLPQPAAPWMSANNSNVTGTTSELRSDGDYAVHLKSGATLGKFAAASIFLGSFKFDIGKGLNDPISLTYFGVPFQATGKIKGVEAEIAYIGGTSKNYDMPISFDYGSVVVELLQYNNLTSDPTFSQYQYHGTYPDGSGPRSSGCANNATAVASGNLFMANHDGTSFKNTPLLKVETGKWVKVFIPITYSTGNIPDYTHLHIVFSCSALGAEFRGYTTSVLKVDNVKLVYEE